MKKKTITKKEIDSLYKKVGISDVKDMPSTSLNTGTLNNKLAGKLNEKELNGSVMTEVLYPHD